jgi:hypothetical protein
MKRQTNKHNKNINRIEIKLPDKSNNLIKVSSVDSKQTNKQTNKHNKIKEKQTNKHNKIYYPIEINKSHNLIEFLKGCSSAEVSGISFI